MESEMEYMGAANMKLQAGRQGGIAGGYVGQAPGAFAPNANSVQQPVSVMVADRLGNAIATLDRIRNMVGEKHFHLFDCPPPSAPSAIGNSPSPGEPSGFEAQTRFILNILNDRLSDLEAAVASLTNRL